MQNTILESSRADYGGTTRLTSEETAALADGQILMEVERFALTSNNVSYARAGDMLGYWDFFPGSDGWGRVPAVGFAKVVESANPEIAAGSRYFGWYPMATHVAFTATATGQGFRDDGDHRAAHAPIYRQYLSTESDPWYEPGDDAEDRHALLRVLFLTGYMADVFFGEHDYFGAQQTIVLSASSKTAIGYAQRAAERDGLATVGLTSAANVELVQAVGHYDTVLTYDQVADIASIPSVSVDMSGNSTVLSAVHRHLGDDLAHSMTIGASHHDAPHVDINAGPTPQFFFVPTEAQRHLDAWGQDEYNRRTTEAVRSFIDDSRRWLTIDTARGPAAAEAAWHRVRDGQLAPAVGQIASLRPGS